MPDALPLTGLYGKVPAHGDFVRRGLPTSFVGPWDAWLQAGVARARENLGDHWPTAWDAAPAWRFALPAGACGPDAVAGVMLPSQDQVGRRFPITLAVLLPPDAATPAQAWFDAAEAAAWAGRHGHADADALAAALPLPGAPLPDVTWPYAPAAGPATPDLPGVSAEAWAPAGLATPTDPASPAADDVLALLTGGAGPLPEAAGTVPPSDVLASPEALAGPAGDQDDVLAMLAGTAPARPGVEASTLAMLIGSGEAVTQAAAAPGPADPLGALLAAAADPDDAPATDILGPPSESEEAAPVAMDSPILPPAEAPPPPEGGGWWTRGATHVPPMVWPLPALPSAEEFAYLLETEA